MQVNLRAIKRDDGWWIVGAPTCDVGPYATRGEADDDQHGLQRFWEREVPDNWQAPLRACSRCGAQTRENRSHCECGGIVVGSEVIR